jgi:hypothetical protein
VARVPESSAKFRSKETIAADVAAVLASDLSWGTKYAVLADAIWTWTEYEGKHEGCRYWSSLARRHRRSPSKLIHEHLVPKKVIITLLREMSAPTSESVHALLERLCIGVVVTRVEDAALSAAGLRSRMPAEWDGMDVWVRYKAVGIEWSEGKDARGTRRLKKGAGTT